MGAMTLKKRQGMLRGIYGAEMPYRDPHTVGPALWALRQGTGAEFEVSVAVVEGSTPWRKGLEALAIALYRQERGESPSVNFGRMPAGYRMSSGNNARLVKAGKRFRGGPTDEEDASHLTGIPPAGSVEGNSARGEWCGHGWSPWLPLDNLPNDFPSTATGLYRIRDAVGEGRLLYVGEGRIRDRLRVHMRKVEKPDHAQGLILASASSLEASWVVDDSWHRHQRLELENDLIGAHVLVTGDVPAAQFLG